MIIAKHITYILCSMNSIQNPLVSKIGYSDDRIRHKKVKQVTSKIT